jgi:hypothetical protein
MFRLGLFFSIIGSGIAFYGYKEIQLAGGASERAEPMTLQQLIDRGPDGNRHVEVTDFVGCENYIFTVRNKNFREWDGAWVPVVPNLPEQEEKEKWHEMVRKFDCIVHLKSVTNEASAARLMNQTRLRGMVTNRIETLGAKERSKLKESYPETDFDNCLILEEGRLPKSRSIALVTNLIGSVICLSGIGILVLKFFGRKKEERYVV